MSRAPSRLRCAAATALGIAFAVSGACRVSIPDDAVFSCASDADCGGGGYVCTPRAAGASVCCHPDDEGCTGNGGACDGEADGGGAPACYTGPEGTLGVGQCSEGTRACEAGAPAEDCAGEVLPVPETCNGLDDDCDGEVDEAVLPLFCYTGPAGTAGVGLCREGTRPCENGAHVATCAAQVLPAAELCNGLDDNCDGDVDEGFDLQTDRLNCGVCQNACSPAGQCVAGGCVESAETSCSDGVDNDLNGLTDCEDPQCDGRSCGPGCTCAGAAATEVDCADGEDNDGDQQTDCADADCAAKACQSAPATFTCDAQLACSCAGVATPPAEAGATCDNGLDDDCDGLTDCADPGCDGQSCGTGCTCLAGGSKETDCADRADNDADGLADCADFVDCPQGTACTFVQGPNVKNGTCQANRTCK